MERKSIHWDLVEEILSRVPVKSVARLRSTSKEWNTLLKSGSFAKKHSANAPKESLTIMLLDSRVFLVKVNLHGIHDGFAPSVKVAGQFNLRDPFSKHSQVHIDNIYHCVEGLLLCTTNENRLLVVWNPCSGETKWIKPRESYTKFDDYALGYDNESSCKNYKILRMIRPASLLVNECEIYDFASDSWRVLVVTREWALSCRGMSMKGNSYWVAHDGTRIFLQSFDFSAERFQTLSLPHEFPYSSGATLSVDGEEQLCLFGSSSNNLDVWATTRPGSVMSWRKLLTVKGEFLFWHNMSFLADEQKKAVVCCNKYRRPAKSKCLDIVGENKHIQVDPLDGDSSCISSYCSVILNYVPSLLHI
ncbi:unnamed protein product [Microthlaspi erraticum]|uniref:F-box domain-containing protein n=1 Tax=Microthlaspi erraticum TaxID=1685480 RepID=A0A6D2HE43_9BRAS|nr:unnamed protein product [Microthlaspi erraticum]